MILAVTNWYEIPSTLAPVFAAAYVLWQIYLARRREGSDVRKARADASAAEAAGFNAELQALIAYFAPQFKALYDRLDAIDRRLDQETDFDKRASH